MPTDVTSTCGSASRDYSTLATAESSTGGDLVTADERRIIEMYDDSVFSYATRFDVAGSTVDATRYRVFRAAAGEEYDPEADTGVRWTYTGADDACRVDEDFCELHSLKLTFSGTTVSRSGFDIHSTDNILDAIFATSTTTNTAAQNHIAFEGNTGVGFDRGTFRNCLAVQDGTTDVGWSRGFNIGSVSTWVRMFNCGAYNFGATTVLKGFSTTTGSTGDDIRNCWAFEINGTGGTVAFDIDAGGDTYCACDDTSLAANTGNQNSLTPADELTDPANGDFQPKSTGNIYEAGTDLSSLMTESFVTGVDHGDATGTWNIGPIDGPAAAGGADFGHMATNIRRRVLAHNLTR